MAADEEVLAKSAIREAIALLREYGVTPEQYATVELVEVWYFAGRVYPDRASAAAAAQQEADRTGEYTEFARVFNRDLSGPAEHYGVKPQ